MLGLLSGVAAVKEGLNIGVLPSEEAEHGRQWGVGGEKMGNDVSEIFSSIDRRENIVWVVGNM